jgi:nitrogen-specific signal transduction histidine kinase/CheY-like chemotaxis protein
LEYDMNTIEQATDALSNQDLRAREQLLERKVAQLERLELMGRLAGGIAHDFNNLLTVILGYTDLLECDVEPGGPMAKAVAEVRRAGERGAALTRQLLALGRQQAARPQPVDLADVVRGMESFLRRLIPEDVRLEVHTAPDAWAIGDRGQFEQVVTNLVVNARDAMRRGGTLQVEVTVEDDVVHLKVRDTGDGMDEETLARIFDPFFTTKTEGRGTGLGLPTVQSILRLYGGDIHLKSAPGLGTTADVWLPKGRGPEPAAGIVNVDPGVGAVAGTVLLVEDDRTVRRIVEVTLTRAGYLVLPAADGSEAVAISRAHGGHVDLVMSDLVLPDTNGFDLAARLRAEREHLKWVFISAHTDHPVLARCVQEDQSSFLPKPFSAQQVVDVVRQALRAEG